MSKKTDAIILAALGAAALFGIQKGVSGVKDFFSNLNPIKSSFGGFGTSGDCSEIIFGPNNQIGPNKPDFTPLDYTGVPGYSIGGYTSQGYPIWTFSGYSDSTVNKETGLYEGAKTSLRGTQSSYSGTGTLSDPYISLNTPKLETVEVSRTPTPIGDIIVSDVVTTKSSSIREGTKVSPASRDDKGLTPTDKAIAERKFARGESYSYFDASGNLRTINPGEL
jgi:hypothetical protein